MASITAARRKGLKRAQYALPRGEGTPKGEAGRYPIDTEGRARNALARVSQFGSAAEKAAVKRAVKRKWPNIKVGGK